jgi:hypothetical protein
LYPRAASLREAILDGASLRYSRIFFCGGCSSLDRNFSSRASLSRPEVLEFLICHVGSTCRPYRNVLSVARYIYEFLISFGPLLHSVASLKQCEFSADDENRSIRSSSDIVTGAVKHLPFVIFKSEHFRSRVNDPRVSISVNSDTDGWSRHDNPFTGRRVVFVDRVAIRVLRETNSHYSTISSNSNIDSVNSLSLFEIASALPEHVTSLVDDPGIALRVNSDSLSVRSADSNPFVNLGRLGVPSVNVTSKLGIIFIADRPDGAISTDSDISSTSGLSFPNNIA